MAVTASPQGRGVEVVRAPAVREAVIEGLIRGAGVSAIIFVVLIFLFLVREGLPAFLEVAPTNLFGRRWYPTFGLYGTVPLILGSLFVTVGAVVIAVPLGLASAIYIGEVAPSQVRDVLKPAIEVLAGIPSVVLGFLGILVVSPLIRRYTGVPTGLTAFTGSLILAYMSLPTIISVAEDALDAVPKEYRDAARALGATEWQTIWRVVVPAARSGIVTAVMLGVGRAIGETMAVMMVTGNAARIPKGPGAFFRPIRTMTATIAAEMGEVAQGSTHFHLLFAVGMILFIITFVINAVTSWVVFRQG
ncbi:MAG: phosphate ABC transporter permease subunit PstC, partial [Anaerolineae bacterium]